MSSPIDPQHRTKTIKKAAVLRRGSAFPPRFVPARGAAKGRDWGMSLSGALKRHD